MIALLCHKDKKGFPKFSGFEKDKISKQRERASRKQRWIWCTQHKKKCFSFQKKSWIFYLLKEA
jgi:hypothetical protein